MMDIGHTPRQRVINRDHGQIGIAVAYGGEDVLERGTWYRFGVRIIIAAYSVRIGSRFTLVRDARSLCGDSHRTSISGGRAVQAGCGPDREHIGHPPASIL